MLRTNYRSPCHLPVPFIRKRFSLLLAFSVSVLLAGFLLGRGEENPGQNILLITIDTLRPDRLSCYSQAHLQTPRVDSLARRGALFWRAFAHNPETLPSHVNIMLGTTPLDHGVHENSKFRVGDSFLTLAEHLKASGYATGAFLGAFPLDSRFGLDQGFDVYDDSLPSGQTAGFNLAERKAELVVQAALGWLKGRSSKWFCWLHLWDPHTPYLPPELFAGRHRDDPYSGEVAYVDSELGRVFDYLEESQLNRKTIIVFTADHGESLGEHGEETHSYFAYNSTIWVPLILAGPGVDTGRIEQTVSHIDIFPTVCDLLRVEKPSTLQGVSLVPLVKGKKTKPRPVYFESLGPYYNRGWAPLRGLIDGGKKYIDSPLPEVYDLAGDFEEKNNLASNADLAKYRDTLKKIQEDFSRKGTPRPGQKVDREALEKLKSLGYVVSPSADRKESYGQQDDLKTLLPLQQNLDRAILLADQGRAEDSASLLKEMIQDRKNFIEAYTYLCQLYLNLRRPEEALQVMAEACQNNPQNFTALSTRGILLVSEGRWKEAVGILRQAVEIIDFDPDVWDNLGIAYWRTGDFPEARKCYEKAMALDKDKALVHSNLGALYLSVFGETKSPTELDQAIRYFQRAVELEPRLILAYRGMGVALASRGELNKAIAAWEKGLEVAGEDDFFILNLGLAYFESGNKKSALEHFEKYLRLKGPTLSPEERRKIEALIEKCKEGAGGGMASRSGRGRMGASFILSTVDGKIEKDEPIGSFETSS